MTKRPFKIGQKVRVSSSPVLAPMRLRRRVGYVVAYDRYSRERPLVHFARALGHDGLGVASHDIPDKIKGHCWYINVTDLKAVV